MLPTLTIWIWYGFHQKRRNCQKMPKVSFGQKIDKVGHTEAEPIPFSDSLSTSGSSVFSIIVAIVSKSNKLGNCLLSDKKLQCKHETFLI